MFTSAVFSSVFFPADWDYEYRAVRSLQRFQSTSSLGELLHHPATSMPVLTILRIDLNQVLSFFLRQRPRAECKETLLFPCKVQSLCSRSQTRVVPNGATQADIRRLVRKSVTWRKNSNHADRRTLRHMAQTVEIDVRTGIDRHQGLASHTCVRHVLLDACYRQRA